MAAVAVIGGSGLTQLKNLEITRQEVARTPYGEPSAPIVFGSLAGREIAFLPRHGSGHTIPPHGVNYRANIWAIKQLGVQRVIAVNAVGGITPGYLDPCTIVIPDQIIDYTYGREHTFFGGDQGQVTHVDFSYPYCEELRQTLIRAGGQAGLAIKAKGCYGATQGPRFETAAEIARLERDGCDIVGMTGMPEAALARELGLCYACVSMVVNAAAGKVTEVISIKEIEQNLERGMGMVRSLLEQAIPLCGEA